jgi:hypothetical protein
MFSNPKQVRMSNVETGSIGHDQSKGLKRGSPQRITQFFGGHGIGFLLSGYPITSVYAQTMKICPRS